MTTKIYLITPPRISSLSQFGEDLKPLLDSGDVACLQLRLKDVTDSEILKAIEFLCPIVQSKDVAFILNDRPDLAASTPCDGVHIGQDDMPYEKARQLMGPERIIGVTCHNSRHLAMEAGEKGADYVAFGAFFPTDTKDVKHRADPEILSWWHDLFTVPSVAIGGITPDNCRVLIEKGADFLAISAGIWNHSMPPLYALKQIKQIITEIYF